MLLLSFHIGAEHYSISAKKIVEILPMTQLKKIHRAPEYILGLLNYRGSPIPILDLCQLTEHRACNKVLSSRIILVDYTDTNNLTHILGITAEKVTETIDVKRDEFFSSGITLEEAPYLGAIANTDEQMIQYIEINNLLPKDVQETLFQNNLPETKTAG